MDPMGNRIFCSDAMPNWFVDDVARSIAIAVGRSRQEAANGIQKAATDQ